MSIYIGLGKKAMQGPCPAGFHIPTQSEIQSIMNYIGNRLTGYYETLLKLPYSGNLQYSSGSLADTGDYVAIWTSQRGISFRGWSDATPSMGTGAYISYGMPIRPFKDEYVAPDSGWTVLYRGNGNQYREAYRNQTLGLISIPNAGITISDKNIGASNVGDYGYYYQWGNSYGFTAGQVTTSSTTVNASGYGPGNYYSSSTFVTNANWETSGNTDLWGYVSSSAIPSEIASVYIGSSMASAVYVGDVKVRPTTPPVVPVDICFGYTGAAQGWTVPSTQEYCIEVWGAQGGNSPSSSYVGGYGGYAAGKICLTEGCNLCIYVGGQPDTCTTCGAYSCGWNGGGCGRVGCYSGARVYSQGGGGGTDVRYKGTTLCHRFIVAGGGAGGTCGSCQSTNMATIGAGGGECGCSPAGSTWTGKQSAAGCRGCFGQGATGGTDSNYKNHAGGGGGGWYGGGATCCKSDSCKTLQCCAGGGSGYTYTSATCGNHPNTSCLSDLPFMTDAVCCPGSGTIPTPTGGSQTGWQGNGCVRIRSV